ncbi:MAG TPA: transcriptional regulator [Deltaproteobacteria bacterium]|nr:transcriptional regulator [Deltaproteobacteria bacterium]
MLLEGPATAKDLSRAVGIPEHDVAFHLEYLERSLRRRGERLVLEPPRCLACEFAFDRRRRYTRPGHCPRCKSPRVSLPVFYVEGRAPAKSKPT